jgi:hypothetical protein
MFSIQQTLSLPIGIAMISDVVFAVMPMFIVWRLGRPFVEKALISFLMALGLFAAAAGIFKIYYTTTFDITSPDTYREMIPMFMWNRIEEIVVVIAACAPLLKSPIELCLHRLGLPTFQYRPRSLAIITTSRRVSSEGSQSYVRDKSVSKKTRVEDGVSNTTAGSDKDSTMQLMPV